MTTPEPEFQQGAGEPTQLEQGAATQLNEVQSEAQNQLRISDPQHAMATVPSPDQAQDPAQVAQDSGVELAQASDYEPQFQADNEDDAFITGPTTRPNEPVTTGIPTGADSIPAEVLRNLPLLQRAAQEPGADPNLQTLVALVLHELNQ
jgi:hypothetical protein